MGTTISMLLPEKQAEKGIQLVYLLFLEWEQTLSRFLPESELSRLNRQAGTPMMVSELLYTVLVAALAAARTTEGVYDPTLHDQLVQLGYDRSFEQLEAVPASLGEAHNQGGAWRHIQLSPHSRRVTLPMGCKLDFGGIAKGMAVDAAVERLRQHGIRPALVNAGGDLAVLDLPPRAAYWPIAVPAQNASWTLPLGRGAMATSGIARRHWLQGQTLRHHLLDPQTGLPALNDLWSVTVVTDWCEQAEVAAKVAFIQGPQDGVTFLRQQNIAGMFIHIDGSWETVAPWPELEMHT
ncbi:FAD:protein FMN transferase [Dictyobacter alpinus]|uniref:FAD:protein FMN transferase n=2 Tax=Dictyobacter alpinus TaxID=2014873 RepID=A0A402BB66_9CHLR|nr:FAD:protein FMN transferase [Dictyobacter alpinus]